MSVEESPIFRVMPESQSSYFSVLQWCCVYRYEVHWIHQRPSMATRCQQETSHVNRCHRQVRMPWHCLINRLAGQMTTFKYRW